MSQITHFEKLSFCSGGNLKRSKKGIKNKQNQNKSTTNAYQTLNYVGMAIHVLLL